MPFLQPILTSSSNPNFDEHRWVIQIRRTLDEDLEDDTKIPVNIFKVPKILMATAPDSYVPQQVALGPYHCWRSELYDMERYKLGAARRTQKQFKCLKFQHLVDQLIKHELRIRASYHKYLDFSGETLAWMMAVDASFLLEFLQVYAVKERGGVLRRITSRMSHLVDAAGRKSAHNSILRDMMMLENQIPLFLLRKVLEFQYSSLDLADTMLLSMLTGLCKEISPFKVMGELPKAHVTDGDHVLGFLYHMIVPKLEELEPQITETEDQIHEVKEGKEMTFQKSNLVKKFLAVLCKLLLKLHKFPLRLLKNLLLSKPFQVIVKLPWKIVSSLPGIRVFKQPLENLCFLQDKEEVKPENENSNSNHNVDKPPLVEEISIPSATQLSKAGVCFAPTNGGIMTITFDEKKCTLYLPTINIDINSEVVLRNLVAYEACNASGPLVFARYTELMNGIIDTGEDARFLRESGIISNRLKSDEEVANICNGMNKSVRLTKVPFLDKVIDDVNKYHDGRWTIKAGKMLKVYVFGSWQFLTLLAAIFLLALMTLQSFCSVYSCARILHFNDIE